MRLDLSPIPRRAGRCARYAGRGTEGYAGGRRASLLSRRFASFASVELDHLVFVHENPVNHLARDPIWTDVHGIQGVSPLPQPIF